MTRFPLAAVAWHAGGADSRLRLAGRYAGEPHFPPGVADALRRLCAELPTLRPSRLDTLRVSAPLHLLGVRVLFALPLRVSTECLGFLLVGGMRELAQDDLSLVQALGIQTSTALYAARLHETEAARSRELGHLSEVLRQQGEQLTRALRLQEELIDIVLRGKDTRTIVDHLGRQLGVPVWLFDTDWQAIGHGGGGGSSPHRLPRESELRRVLGSPPPGRDPRPVALATTKGIVSYLVQSISTDQDTFGYLLVASGSLGPADRIIFQGGCLVLALRLLIERSVAEAGERAGRDLLQDVLARRGGRLTAAAVAARLGCSEDGQAAVLTLRTRGVTASPGSHPDSHSRRVAALVRDELRSGEHERGLVGVVGEEVVAIVRPAEAEACAGRVCSRLAATLPGVDIAVGISDTRHRLEDLEPGYREAIMALTLAERSHTRVLRFADLGLHRLLFDVTHAERVDEHVERWIGPLIRYDADHDARLVETLSCYLDGVGHREVAARLNIHPSTLKYRLRRIREILRADLTHADARFNIQLGLRLAESMQARSPETRPRTGQLS